MGSFIYIMGKSSSGKDTINKKLQEKLELNSYVMYTTRPIREGEKNGVDYYYVTEEKIKELQNEDKVIESRTYNTKFGPWTYATIDDGQLDGNNNLLCVGTLESYIKVKEYFDKYEDKKLIPVYIEISEEEREKRAFLREAKEVNPKYEEVKRRLQADNIDFSEENLNNAGITSENRFLNYDLNECVNKIINYVQKAQEKINIRKNIDEREER